MKVNQTSTKAPSRLLSAFRNGGRRASEQKRLVIKIQTYTPDTMTINCNLYFWLILVVLCMNCTRRAHTPFEWHEELFEHAKIDVTIFSTPFDETAVDLLESLGVPAYKKGLKLLIYL